MMIAFIKGKVSQITEEGLIIDVGGIGILTLAPLAMLNPRPILGEEIFLHTHMQIREDNWQLFGFQSPEQLAVFKYLIGVSGVGAKTALAILNTLNPGLIAQAVTNNDYNLFCSVPGIGKKTAQRLALELRDKLGNWQSNAEDIPSTGNAYPTANSELFAALNQLGFSMVESRALALAASEKLGPGADTNSLLKESLRLAAKG